MQCTDICMHTYSWCGAFLSSRIIRRAALTQAVLCHIYCRHPQINSGSKLYYSHTCFAILRYQIKQTSHHSYAFVTVQKCFLFDAQACYILEGITSRGVDLGSKEDFPNTGPLHVAAQRDFFFVARLLLDNEIPTDTLSENGQLAVQIALEEENDELSALIMRKMPKARCVEGP